MAIKDIIVPGFVGTTTIKWIVTRGLSIGAAPTIPVADVFYSVRGAAGLSVPVKGITGLSVEVKGDQ